MKRKVLGLSIGIIVILIGIIGLSYNPNNKTTFTQHGVTYALTLDGANVNTFPSKGMYRADVKCTNATGKWLYDEWKLAIEDINSDNITCDIDFSTINKTNLTDYVISLSGSEQGTGQVVDEPNATISDYTNATPTAQSNYSSVTMYESSSDSSTSGTTNTNSFTFSGNSWSSVPSNLTSNNYYHIKFRPSTSGYYQVCYTMSSGQGNNYLYIHKGTALGESIPASTSSAIEGCVDIGYVDTNTDVRIVQRAAGSSLDLIATITFNLQKATSTESVDTGYRYEGKNPNNYIWFNNELWRIIGVFDEESHGVSGQNLVKIIRNDPIGALSWDDVLGYGYGSNDWSTSDLKKLLNEAYLNSENGTDEGHCYEFSPPVPGNCDYTENGINDTYRSMIENVTWYLGGYSYASATAEIFYGYERGTTVYSGRPTEWEGKIGLMYPSDYGYSVLSSSCARTTNLMSYNNAACAGQSWLYTGRDEWALSPHSSNSINVFNVTDRGYLTYGRADDGYAARPVLYLDSNVYVLDGDGSQSDPYIIGM